MPQFPHLIKEVLVQNKSVFVLLNVLKKCTLKHTFILEMNLELESSKNYFVLARLDEVRWHLTMRFLGTHNINKQIFTVCYV